MKYLLFFCSLFVFLSCHNKSFYFYEDRHLISVQDKLNKMVISPSSFKLYTRRICHFNDENPKTWGNCEDIDINETKRVEIEYLFVSFIEKKVLYVANIPTFDVDGGRKENIYNNPIFDNPQFVNSWYFNVICFGTLDVVNNTVKFEHKSIKDKVDTWVFSKIDENIIEILELHEFEGTKKERIVQSNTALPFKLSFKRQDVFQIGIKSYIKQEQSSFNPLLQANTLHWCFECKRNLFKNQILRRKGYNLFLRFTEPISDNSSKKWIYFSDSRIKYKPWKSL